MLLFMSMLVLLFTDFGHQMSGQAGDADAHPFTQIPPETWAHAGVR